MPARVHQAYKLFKPLGLITVLDVESSKVFYMSNKKVDLGPAKPCPGPIPDTRLWLWIVIDQVGIEYCRCVLQMTSMGQPKSENVNANPIHKLKRVNPNPDYKVAVGLGNGSECNGRLMGQFEVVWQIRNHVWSKTQI